jgi:hypothetical protein
MSGFCSTIPPVEEKLLGVYAAPAALKNIRRGPSELKVSTGLAAPPVKGVVRFWTSLAATQKALGAPEAL